MKKNIQSVRGMKDYLPSQVIFFKKIEKIFQDILFSYGYQEIRTPIVEKEDLFQRAVGITTDVIKKEMYTFKNSKGKRFALRPEGTAGCVRAAIQNNLLNKENKIWYIGPMFRYERPQNGRYRQFYQFGVEVFGFSEPNIDAELIFIASIFWKILKISNYITLNINCIGSLEDRKHYEIELISFLKKNKSILDDNAIYKLNNNPIRILDTKNPKIQNLLKHAPKINNFLNINSQKNFSYLCKILENIGIKYYINPLLVRGLDYYTQTVFEFTTKELGSQNTICAGGRYDTLVKTLGGPNTPAIGFAVGLDRLYLLIKKVNSKFYQEKKIHLHIFPNTKDLQYQIIILAEKIRKIFPKIRFLISYKIFNIKKQIQIAVKKNTQFLLILKKEIHLSKSIFLKDLISKKQRNLTYNELIKILSKFF